MSKPVKKVLILGGGSAGWLTAGVIAAEHGARLDITLVESPDVPIIGVGEGTWPSMRETLRKMGVSERDFLSECDASFKQGSKFISWKNAEPGEFYYHPFSIPQGFFEVNSIPFWQARAASQSFADAVCAQEVVCEHGLAPKQVGTPEYAGVVNYGYHLDAVKFGRFLRDHCTSTLSVRHIVDHVVAVNSSADGYVESLATQQHGALEADLFVDCSGTKSVLLGEHYDTPFVSRQPVLFNDRALAVQVPYPGSDGAIASATLATAQRAGWIWDIGLPTRRGVGYVYSSAHTDDAQAEADLRSYLEPHMGKSGAGSAELRLLKFRPGHRGAFWHKNCVAVGMSAGFIEPLEASALALAEMSAAMIRDDLPENRAVMDIVAARFNERFRYRWDRIIDFLKLHYVLSRRTDSDYWHDHRDPECIPENLQALLELWRYRSPSRRDFLHAEEIFTAASYQYVLYGMGFETKSGEIPRRSENLELARRCYDENERLKRRYTGGLPANRSLLTELTGSAQRQAGIN